MRTMDPPRPSSTASAPGAPCHMFDLARRPVRAPLPPPPPGRFLHVFGLVGGRDGGSLLGTTGGLTAANSLVAAATLVAADRRVLEAAAGGAAATVAPHLLAPRESLCCGGSAARRLAADWPFFSFRLFLLLRFCRAFSIAAGSAQSSSGLSSEPAEEAASSSAGSWP